MTTRNQTSPVVSRSARYQFNWRGKTGLAVILFWSVMTLFGHFIAPYPISKIVDTDYFGPMRGSLLMGSDYLGRDVFSRVIIGARYTVGISFAATALAGAAGVLLGMTAATIGGLFDTMLSRVMDAVNSIPSLLFGLVVVAALGSSIEILIVLLGVIYMPGSYRFVRSLAFNINTMDYVTVARVRGEKTGYLIIHEILPGIVGPVLTDLGLRFVYIVLVLSGLSFLGLGVQPPNADWGGLVHENIGGLNVGAPAVVFPCLCIASLTIAVNMFIDNLPRKISDRGES